MVNRQGFVLEGRPATKLIEAIRRVGHNDYDRFVFGTVTSEPPELRIRIDNGKFCLDADDLIIPENLTHHDVTIRRADGTTETVTIENGLRVGDRVIIVRLSGGQKFVVIDRM